MAIAASCRASYPLNRSELERRHGAYARERKIVAAIGYTPFLLLYVLVHTRLLRPYMPASPHATAAVLILLPGAWLGMLVLLQRWVGPIRHRLRCPGCRRGMVGMRYQHALDSAQCDACGTTVIANPPIAD